MIFISIATRRSGHGPTAAVRGAGEAQELQAGSPVPVPPVLPAARGPVPLGAAGRAVSLRLTQLHQNSPHPVKTY